MSFSYDRWPQMQECSLILHLCSRDCFYHLCQYNHFAIHPVQQGLNLSVIVVQVEKGFDTKNSIIAYYLCDNIFIVITVG